MLPEFVFVPLFLAIGINHLQGYGTNLKTDRFQLLSRVLRVLFIDTPIAATTKIIWVYCQIILYTYKIYLLIKKYFFSNVYNLQIRTLRLPWFAKHCNLMYLMVGVISHFICMLLFGIPWLQRHHATRTK